MTKTFTVRVVTTTCTREHYNVATIGHKAGALGFIALKNPENKVIAFYKDSAYSSWHVVQEQPTSTGPHLRFPFTGVDVEDGKGTPITTKIEQQRDHLGRFTKRK